MTRLYQVWYGTHGSPFWLCAACLAAKETGLAGPDTSHDEPLSHEVAAARCEECHARHDP